MWSGSSWDISLYSLFRLRLCNWFLSRYLRNCIHRPFVHIFWSTSKLWCYLQHLTSSQEHHPLIMLLHLALHLKSSPISTSQISDFNYCVLPCFPSTPCSPPSTSQSLLSSATRFFLNRLNVLFIFAKRCSSTSVTTTMTSSDRCYIVIDV